jgi:uncharacterized protein involved in exopolysaccharide biosynthesis
MRYDIDIFHYINIYKGHWKRMAILIALVFFITVLMQSLHPGTYRSTLIALSSKEASQTVKLGFGLPNLALGGSSDDVIFSMLKSRRMRKDIDEHFNLKDKPKFWWSLDTYIVTGGFAVEVKGPDPELTREIANFAVANLDKINKEIGVSTEVPMVKVLDPAITGSPIGRNVFKKAVAICLIVFLAYTLFIFFREYFAQLKKSSK